MDEVAFRDLLYKYTSYFYITGRAAVVYWFDAFYNANYLLVIF